ncbi:hypothetical protein FRC10_008628 [Ceratobasidium sp. 414]|nr:hypothetical protein FRC10_008628 [Ceratobasidium sp. 414]
MSSSSKPPNRGIATPPPSSTSNKRNSSSLAGPNHVGSATQQPRANQSWYGQARTTTPRRAGSTQHTRESSGNTDAASRSSRPSKFHTTDTAYSRTSATPLATATPHEQHEMDRLLESEMEGAIFCDFNFVDKFFTVDTTRLQTVLDDCKGDLDGFRFREHITRERQLYNPIRELLNTIKRAVDGVPDLDNLPAFVDVSAEPILSHCDDTAGIKPDLALFDGSTRHWETMRMPIEVKRQETYLKTGMKQLTRYARAVFAHQLHRRHLYGLAICKWDATFVRFDRSGILYSKPINMRSEEFRKAFAGLMMLDEEAIGYDTAFTTRARRNGRLEYYVDLPAEAFPTEEGSCLAADAETEPGANASTAIAGPSDLPSTPLKPATRRLRVMERLCHRKSIRGRATIVVRIREVIRPGYLDEPEEAQGRIKTRSRTKWEQQPAEEIELLGARDYVLKMMWRDPNKKMEGEVLERLVGIYGVGQHMWHSDVFKACNCGGTMDDSCGDCLDRTPNRDRVFVTKNLTDLDIEIPEEKEGEETQYKAVHTDEYSPAYARQTSRIYCRLLMSTIGSPLCSAESPRQLLDAVLDAILGYWRLVNKGLLHRDISDGNVLMLREGQGYNKQEWKTPRATMDGLDPGLAESERLLRAVLDRLGRDPTGMLNDFDLFTTHGELGATFFGDSPPEDDECEAEGPEPKRRKLSSGAVASATPSSSNRGKGREEDVPGSSLSRAAGVDKRACQAIDFRTGTPTFMSSRVLKVKLGHRYEHHFMDDLESFFWLIFCSVVEHVDVRGAKVARDALGLLDQLDRRDLIDIGRAKGDLLGECFGKGSRMRVTLASCENSWATDPAIVSVVLKLGALLHGVYLYETLEECSPNDVFPSVVDIIMGALSS